MTTTLAQTRARFDANYPPPRVAELPLEEKAKALKVNLKTLRNHPSLGKISLSASGGLDRL